VTEGVSFDIDSPDLRSLLTALKEVEPKLATDLRRELRRSGDAIIGKQRDALGSGDTRDAIGSGLRTRVTAGKTRQSISVSSSGPKRGGANMAKLFELRRFRHPVFGSGTWVEQSGFPYFNTPARSGFDEMRERIADVVDDAIGRVAR
jgi:hypothetical protein